MPFVLGLVGLTSVGAYLVGTRKLGLPANGIRLAAAGALECIGMTLVFFIVNVMAGVVIVLAARILTRQFVSLYFADETLLVLSLLQGLVFKYWRGTSSVP